jgi:MtrB/PioB family decaheme-associated outer membrane protein
MKRKLLSILVANAFVASPVAFAAEGLTWTGSASLGYRYTNENASDPSKLNEYRDLDDAVLNTFDFRARSDSYYFNGFLENLGSDDIFLDLKGGKYGSFKYQIYNNELRHNFGSGPGARSPYSGIGGPTLTATFPSLNPNTWNSFDHSYERRDTGAMVEFSFNSPWYFRAEGNEVARKGINVFASSQGTSPGNGFVDLPAPIDYKTGNFSVEGGYQGKNEHFAVNLLYSKFSNDNSVVNFSNGFFASLNPANRDTHFLPPENEMWRISANGNVRKLPGNSTLAGRFTYQKLTNDILIQPTMLGANTAVLPATPANTGSFPATNPSTPLYNGEIKKTTFGLSFASQPARELDTRLYYNYAKEDNNSTHITFTPSAANPNSGLACSGGPCTPEPFGYTKHNAGVEAGYRINRENKLTGIYDYYDVDRDRIDFTGNTDNKFSVEWKNSSLDELTGRVKYQYLSRRSDYALISTSELVVANPTEFYVRRFDLANVDQNMFKIVLDASPAQFVDLGFEAIYKKNDYKDTQLGRTDDKRQEYYASISFGDPKSFRVMLFGDIEFVEYNSVHRIGATTLANADPAAPPSGAPNSSIYTWNAKNEDKSWQVGLGADWLPMDRLKLNASLIWAKTEGTTEFNAQPGTIINPPFFYPINNFDNTTRKSLSLKGTYRIDRNWEVTGGYAYERYKYSDIGYDNTTYVAGTGTGASYTTGQFAFQPYSANIFYVYGTYKF